MAHLLERDPDTGHFLPLKTHKIRVDRFKSYIRSTRSAQTAYSYVAAVRRFETFLDEKGVLLKNAPKGLLDDFVVWLTEKNLSAATIQLVFCGVRSYTEWCRTHDDGGCPEFAMPRLPKGDPPDPFVLSTDQLVLYFSEVSKLLEPSRTALLIVPYCGLRVTELCKQKMGQIGHETFGGRKWIVFRMVGKGRKPRPVPLPKEAEAILKSYLLNWKAKQPKAKKKEVDWLFPGKYQRKGVVTPLSSKTLQAHIRNIRERAGLPKNVTPHALRRTCLTNLYRKGLDIAIIAKIAGHASIETTIKHYIAMSPKDMLEKLAALTERTEP